MEADRWEIGDGILHFPQQLPSARLLWKAGDRHSLKTGNKRGIINTGTIKLKLKAQQPTGMETSFS